MLTVNKGHIVKSYLRILLTVLIIIFAPFHTFAQSKNELVIGIGTTQGSITNAKGIHGPVTGNAGTNVKLVTLVDDKLKSDTYISLDYYRNLTGGLYLNAGISSVNVSTSTTQADFVGGYSITTFPTFNLFGYMVDIGPSYRFNTNSSYTPFVGLNASVFGGSADNTRFADGALYGVGGNHTYVECIGYTPRIGVYKNSGFFQGFGITINSTTASCNIGAFRSYENGFRGDLSFLRYQLDYRVSF